MRLCILYTFSMFLDYVILSQAKATVESGTVTRLILPITFYLPVKYKKHDRAFYTKTEKSQKNVHSAFWSD